MKKIEIMDKEADKVILKWSAGGLIGNLAPPPFDSIAVVSAMAKMGYDIAIIYEDVEFTKDEAWQLAKLVLKAMRSVGFAAKLGTNLLKYIPGVNVWVALFVQPPIVAAMSYTTGQSYKKYYRTIQLTGKKPEDSEMVKFAKSIFKQKLEEAKIELKKKGLIKK